MSQRPIETTAAATAAGDNAGSPLARLRRSFQESVGSIVFGMEDGTVSIFGLVFGLAASAPDSRAVLVAGATGAGAATVSMMAGTFLDVESTNDQADRRADAVRTRYEADPATFMSGIQQRLRTAGVSQTDAQTVARIASNNPDAAVAVATAVEAGVAVEGRQSPWVQSVWMFVTNLFAAAVPVIPFAFFPIATARIVSLIVTLLLLIVLGFGRARIGARPVLSTVAETVGIAALAGAAGVVISSWFGD